MVLFISELTNPTLLRIIQKGILSILSIVLHDTLNEVN